MRSTPPIELKSLQSKLSENSDTRCLLALRSQVDKLLQAYAQSLYGVRYVAIAGYPDHPNKGDSAIWSGEVILLQALNVEVVHVFRDLSDYNVTIMRDTLSVYNKTQTAILFHGGGNMGDLWYNHQMIREQVVLDFKDYSIRSFPQSMRYQQQETLDNTKAIYKDHPDLGLVARDTKSFLAMKREFGAHHRVELLPDVATMLLRRTMQPWPPAKVDYLVQTRTDLEGGQNHTDAAEFAQLAATEVSALQQKTTTGRQISDWLTEDPFGSSPGIGVVNWNHRAWVRVIEAWKFLGQGRVLVTDRLHAHILSTLWNRPHVVLEDGDYGKIESYHSTWLAEDCADRVRMSTTAQEAVNYAKELYVKEANSFQANQKLNDS